jgi:UDP-N-acetylmuramoylalanine--D-glutamate ligase
LGKSVVVGAARSGIGAANLLAALGNDVTVTDLKPEDELGEFLAGLSPSVKRALGGHPDAVFEGAELVVVSPGVPLGIEPLAKARKSGIEVIGELEFAFRAMRKVPFYAVTGTNGKSTTATLLDMMMKKCGRKSIIGGNIGNALSTEITVGKKGEPLIPGVDCVVAEVSSFQLEAVRMFRPAGAAILNITPDHLDRHASMAEYRDAKARISRNQGGEDILVLNADDTECMELYHTEFEPRGTMGPWVFFFSRRSEINGVFLRDGMVCWDFRSSGAGELIRAEEIGIKGVHNLENAMAAAALALLSGCQPLAVAGAMREFEGLEHRLEFVRELKGVRYINDSKGTNVGAALKSVESFSQPIVLIAGGRDKNGDFKALAEVLKGKARAAVLIGEAGEKIRHAFESAVECHTAGDLGDAVGKASALASAGDVVLLSPACASFDMFRDFEDRGRQFKRMVKEL